MTAGSPHDWSWSRHARAANIRRVITSVADSNKAAKQHTARSQATRQYLDAIVHRRACSPGEFVAHTLASDSREIWFLPPDAQVTAPTPRGVLREHHTRCLAQCGALSDHLWRNKDEQLRLVEAAGA